MTYTRSGDPEDAARRRERFWRASVGVDRLLTPDLRLTLEAAWNGYGVDDPARYPALLRADRIRRGEVNALGRRHAGWRSGGRSIRCGPVEPTALANLRDRSILWIPAARWSTSDETALLVGAQVPVGPGRAPDGRPRSEYGLAPTTLFASFTIYF